MEEKKAQALFKKYASGNCTEEEKALLETWYLQHSRETHPDMDMQEQLEDRQQIRAALDEAIVPVKLQMNWFLPVRMAAASIAFILVSFGLYNYFIKTTKPSYQDVPVLADVPPGGNKAVLTLNNGHKIELSSDKNGIIIKADQLTYNDGTQINTTDNQEEQTTATKNTIATPVGGQYQVVLEDGTKVWLNAASSLSFPVHFTGKERQVSITGEAYFEVAHNKAVPFKVSSKGQTIAVLGTHFNLMAYENEVATKTTLLSGSVRITPFIANGTHDVVLKPNQQATLNGSSQIKVEEIDGQESIAWKNGYFRFNEDIRSIMNKIARWYDIDVVYRAGVDLNQTFSGEVSKTRNVSVLLNVMELTGNVHFKIDGRRIIVMP